MQRERQFCRPPFSFCVSMCYVKLDICLSLCYNPFTQKIYGKEVNRI